MLKFQAHYKALAGLPVFVIYLVINLEIRFSCDIPTFISLKYLYGLYMSSVMRKPAFRICENKEADQLCGNPTYDQRIWFGHTDSTILL